MPLFFQTPLSPANINSLATTVVGSTFVFARRGPNNRLLFSAQDSIHPQGFGLYNEYTSKERSDTEPTLGTLNGQAFVAWKGDGNDHLNLARVVLDSTQVVGLVDKETFAEQGRGPLTLVATGDRFLLGHTTSEGRFAYASLVPFDPAFRDPLAADTPGCELCAVTAEDKFFLVSRGDLWNVVGRYNRHERLKLGDGWLSLLLTLKEGCLDVYQSGETSEWQGILGDQVYWNELSQLPDEATEEQAESNEGDDSLVLHYLAISDPDDVKRSAEALAALTKKSLRARYERMATTSRGSRVSGKEFDAAWQTLQDLVAFLQMADTRGLSVVHRTLLPAEPPAPLPEVGKVKVKVPAAKQAAAPHPDGLGVLARAADSFGVVPDPPAHEWPFNVLSQKAVRYGSGRIARTGDDPEHDYDPAELERCHRVAAEAAARFARLPVRTVNLGKLEPFCLPANRKSKVPAKLTPEHVRTAFRGTLHPWAEIVLQPIRECRVRNLEAERSLYRYRMADVKLHNRIWADNVAWYERHPDLSGGWYVSIEGGGLHGCQAVRLLVGMTNAGSLTGVATVELGNALTRTLEPKDMYAPLRELEHEEFKQWLDPDTGRVKARALLRAFKPDVLKQWAEQTQAAVRKLKPKDRGARWLAEFHQVEPERTLTLSPLWEAVQRCLTNGRFARYPEPEAKVFFSGWHQFGVSGTPRGLYCYQGDVLLHTANWLAAHDTAWFQKRYDDLRATDYAPFMSDVDRHAAVDTYAAVQEFYTQAAERFAVVVEISAESPEGNPAAAESKSARKKAKAGRTGAAACKVDTDMLAPLLECMESYNPDEARNEWPHNDVSTRTERYTCGNISREGQEIEHDHDPAEEERCRRLAAEGEKLLRPLSPPNDQGGPYMAFFSTANRGDPVPEEFTESFLRERLFRGTINPEVGIHIEPLTAARVWETGNQHATKFVDWLRAQPGLHGFAFVSIGIDEDTGGASHPRLALALTDKGSVVGICGYVIWA